ncbi:MAG: hypothetical protein HY735_25045 [Verrucomicrobia bacterium]|nr:hypothetical protein [Verrucomicrobiota bacterium]
MNLPASVAAFVQARSTIPLPEETAEFPYSEFFWKATVCILLSGRVKANTEKGVPNRTDLNRFCKQANFNQYLCATIAEFLVAAKVVKAVWDQYEPGPALEDFLSRDLDRLIPAAQAGLHELVHRFTPFHSWRPTFPWRGMVGFVRAFFGAFAGRALREDELGGVFRAFAGLPERDRKSLLQQGKPQRLDPFDADWEPWLDTPGQEALTRALYAAGWAYSTTVRDHDWFCLSRVGAIFLGLADAPPPPAPVLELAALADLRVLAGVDLPLATLLPLFRHCRVERLDRVLEFRLDKKVMQEVPAKSSVSSALLKALKPCQPLPGTVRQFLGDQTLPGGTLQFLACRGMLRASDPNLLSAIRSHPKLKGYLDSKAPPGCLVIKENSDPAAFIARCQAHGFEVKPW